jgi:hypothetical protein
MTIASVRSPRSGAKASRNHEPILRTSLMVQPAIATPNVAPNTRISGGSMMTPSGLAPSITIMNNSATTASTMPNSVVVRMAQTSSAPGAESSRLN